VSIYTALWRLKFPKISDDHSRCEWIEVCAHERGNTVDTGAIGIFRQDTPLLTLSGKEYACTPFAELHERICFALRDVPAKNVAKKPET
jgi:hypothetical protein